MPSNGVGDGKTMRTIAVEEHFVTPSFMAGPGRAITSIPLWPMIRDQLLDLGSLRIEEMDAAGVDVQMLMLHSPGVEQLGSDEAVELARETNDLLAHAVKNNPGRLSGFATLPIQSPELAAAELTRAVGQLGLRGAVINGHSQGRYLDDSFFWPVLERAEALGVPIYLHPTQPPRPVVKASYEGNFSPESAYVLSVAGWGWHVETATHILRLILSGAFDRYPELQFIVGHLGEGLPFFLQRFDQLLSPRVTGLKRPVSAYLRENLYYSFSGFTYLPAFLNLLLEIGADRILFSCDHPYSSMARSREFLDQLPVSAADKERIAYRNAEELLRP